MEQELLQKLEAQEQRIAEIQRSVDQMRRYFLWMLIVTIAVIVLPLLGLIVVIPQFVNTYQSALEGL